MFYLVIEEAFPYITDMLNEVCELGKEQMKTMDEMTLGSWKRAVTTSGILVEFFPRIALL